jgi:mono/diheme cytochrome c family protein
MTRWTTATLLVVLALTVAGCTGRRSPSQFSLPPGDPAAGKAAFVELKCSGCHTVEGVDLPAPTAAVPVKLGGGTPLPPTTGDLTTDIIMPSSHFARGYPASQVQEGAASKMPDYTRTMTIGQLADVVAFLKSHYRVGVS